MQNFDYGTEQADLYDEVLGARDDTADTVQALAALARAGRALELGVGTGRVAIPLSELVRHVHGVDISRTMVTKLQSKPGGHRVSVSIGDFADVSLRDRYSLIYVVSDTIFGLLSHGKLQRCLDNVSQHLAPDGTFVVEATVPHHFDYIDASSLTAKRMSPQAVELQATTRGSEDQVVLVQAIVLRAGQVSLFPYAMRYITITQLDRACEIAGLSLRERWSNWTLGGFTDASKQHVSIYELAAAATQRS